jgi:hypothetical protein
VYHLLELALRTDFSLARILVVFVLLDVVAMGWGAESRERVESQEWERRKEWPCKENHTGGKTK